ncbi:MAG: hypothetical protein J6Y02_02080 [Pseudobutyrivibrio sp.]|nr:hypothetical protein [Pseudobutyrivibrio sp.]
MSAELSANAVQVVPANSSVVFTETPVPCKHGLVYHRDGSGIVRLANRFFRQNINSCWRRNSNYLISFHANIAVPTGGTVEAISLAVAIDGEIDPSSIMTFTPAAVNEYGNVGAEVIVQVPFLCGCSSVSIRNNSTQSINVQNANLVIDIA